MGIHVILDFKVFFILIIDRFSLVNRQFAWNTCKCYCDEILITTFKKIQLHLSKPIKLLPETLTWCIATSKVATVVPLYWNLSILPCLLFEELTHCLVHLESHICSTNLRCDGSRWKAVPNSCHPMMSISFWNEPICYRFLVFNCF